MTENEIIVLLWLHVWGDHPPSLGRWYQNALETLKRHGLVVDPTNELTARGLRRIEQLKAVGRIESRLPNT